MNRRQLLPAEVEVRGLLLVFDGSPHPLVDDIVVALAGLAAPPDHVQRSIHHLRLVEVVVADPKELLPEVWVGRRRGHAQGFAPELKVLLLRQPPDHRGGRLRGLRPTLEEAQLAHHVLKRRRVLVDATVRYLEGPPHCLQRTGDGHQRYQSGHLRILVPEQQEPGARAARCAQQSFERGFVHVHRVHGVAGERPGPLVQDQGIGPGFRDPPGLLDDELAVPGDLVLAGEAIAPSDHLDAVAPQGVDEQGLVSEHEVQVARAHPGTVIVGREDPHPDLVVHRSSCVSNHPPGMIASAGHSDNAPQRVPSQARQRGAAAVGPRASRVTASIRRPPSTYGRYSVPALSPRRTHPWPQRAAVSRRATGPRGLPSCHSSSP